jgi:hypothetical protein
MLHGVLNMPPELWIGTPIDVMQRHSRYIQASEYIKELTEQRDRLAKACDQYSEDESLCKLHEVTEQRDRLVEERDELKKQLIDAKSSTAFWMGKYNNAIQLRGEDPLCDSFWKTLDKLSAERALADRLADALTNPAVYVAVDALMAWKEARSE